MPDVKEIREYFLSELEGSSPETRRVRLFWCDKFLKHTHGKALSEWDKRLVGAFMRQMEKEKYTPLTVRNAMGVVRRVYDAARAVHERERTKLIASVDPNNPAAVAEVLKAMVIPSPRWDVPKRFLPEVNRTDISSPAVDYEDIKKMVTAAKSGALDVPQVAYLCLASFYGLRAGELRAVMPEHIDYGKGLIWINTEKGGEKRNQLLPEELYPYLNPWKFELDYSPYMMWKMFKEICRKAEVGTKYHQAWHCFRRYLDTAVRDVLGGDQNLKRDAQLITKIWFRWKLSSSSEMTDRYYTANPLDADKIVVEHHPLLKLWQQ